MVQVPSGLPVFDTARSIVFLPVKSPFGRLPKVVRTTMKRWWSGSYRHTGSMTCGPITPVVRLTAAG